MKSVFALCLLFTATIVHAQPTLSDSAEISVITCGPWQHELYSAFGHSAFRVYDPEHGIDDAYNYGVFDFNQPNFYLNFARGYLNYKLGVYDYQRFRDYYIYYNRYVHEQRLNLTQQEKQKLYEYLIWNALPENQYYRYDYFFDNCATKIRDVIAEVFGENVRFDGSYVNTDYSFRELTDIYLAQQPWGDLGIDIGLGLPIDRQAMPYEYMFLPDYIESGFNHAFIKSDGVEKPLVRETISVYEVREAEPEGGLPHPLLIFGVLLAIAFAITLWDFKRKKISNWFDGILFGIVGLIGLLLLSLWLFTDHHAAARNLNLLWAWPTHLVAVVGLMTRPKWLRGYFLINEVALGAVLLFWFLLPQDLNTALIPVALTLLLRAFAQHWLRRAAPAQGR
ncbi:MAG: DUF4105 domain-containing protein [Bacteroidia bacterium]|nr:DUF4105 domain-containing protein [Bacteroidia bacterium]